MQADEQRREPGRDFISRASEHVRQMQRAGMPRGDILARLAREGERLAGPGSVVSILVLDEEGLLRNGSSPGLPPDDLAAIDRLRPDARVGTCAAAAVAVGLGA